MENAKTARLFLKVVEFYYTFDIQIDKPHFLESPQTSLKTRQYSYQ